MFIYLLFQINMEEIGIDVRDEAMPKVFSSFLPNWIRIGTKKKKIFFDKIQSQNSKIFNIDWIISRKLVYRLLYIGLLLIIRSNLIFLEFTVIIFE